MSAAPGLVCYDLPLFVPADKPDRYAKAIDTACDAVIIDLEDAVARTAKAAARETLAAQGARIAGARKPVFVRINGPETAWCPEDLALCARLPLTGVLLPKCESAAQLRALRAALPKTILCLALIETAHGLAAATEIALAADRLVFGSVDFCADIGCAHDRMALLMARHSLVLASRLAGLPAPLDGVTTALRDAGLVRDDAAHAATLGMGGKLLIHPAQIQPAREGLAPSAERVAWARAVLATPEGSAVAVDGAMIDAPVIAQARHVLARAAQQ